MVNRKSRANVRPARLAGVSGRPTKGGLVQVGLTLDPEALEKLREEALRRAKARKSGRPDVSEIVREAIEAWISKHGKH